MADSNRVAILKAIAELFSTWYGPAAENANNRILRSVRRGQWLMDGAGLPKCTVVDGGQARDATRDRAEGAFFELTVLAILDLDENWSREEAPDRWSDLIQTVVGLAHVLSGNGIETVNVVDDRPFQMPGSSGGNSTQHWVVEWRVMYWDRFAGNNPE